MTHEKQPLATEDLAVRAKTFAAVPETGRWGLWPEYQVGSGKVMQADDAHLRSPTPADYRGWGINE